MNTSTFSFIPLMASEEKIFEYFFAWQPIEFSGLDKIHMVGRGPLKEHFCKSFVKLSVMR